MKNSLIFLSAKVSTMLLLCCLCANADSQANSRAYFLNRIRNLPSDYTSLDVVMHGKVSIPNLYKYSDLIVEAKIVGIQSAGKAGYMIIGNERFGPSFIAQVDKIIASTLSYSETTQNFTAVKCTVMQEENGKLQLKKLYSTNFNNCIYIMCHETQDSNLINDPLPGVSGKYLLWLHNFKVKPGESEKLGMYHRSLYKVAIGNRGAILLSKPFNIFNRKDSYFVYKNPACYITNTFNGASPDTILRMASLLAQGMNVNTSMQDSTNYVTKAGLLLDPTATNRFIDMIDSKKYKTTNQTM